MTDEMNRLIGAFAPGEDARLAGVEDAVWARIGERREQARLGQVRVAAVAFALVIGVANGGLMLLTPRPEPSEMRIFTVSAGLSPLGGLDQQAGRAASCLRAMRSYSRKASTRIWPPPPSGAASRPICSRARSTTASAPCGTARRPASTVRATCSSTPTSPEPCPKAGSSPWPARQQAGRPVAASRKKVRFPAPSWFRSPARPSNPTRMTCS